MGTRKRHGWDRAQLEASTGRIREPDPDLQFLKLRASRVRFWRILRILTVILLAYLTYTLANPAPVSTPSPHVDLDPSGKQAAWAKTADWLTRDDPLGRDARIVSWDGSRTLTLTDGKRQVDATRHTLTVETGDHRWWSVRITIDPDGANIGMPAASPLNISVATQTQSTLDWEHTLSTVQPSDALATLVSQWGQAYAGTDMDRLKVVVNDPDQNAVYQPLMLGDADSTTIDKAAYLDRGRVDEEGRTSDMAAIRATITLKPKDAAHGATSMSYDLLVKDPDGSPRILAWGAPGEAATLREYANRWKGQPIDQQTLDANRQQDSQEQ